MLRWMILLASFLFWLGALGLVWQHKRSIDNAPISTSEANLRALFKESDGRRAWRLYVDANQLRAAIPMAGVSQKDQKPFIWDGVNQKGLVELGWLENVTFRRHETRISQTTELDIKTPHEIEHPVAKFINRIHVTSSADYTVEMGLEGFTGTTELHSPAGKIELRLIGVRENSELLITRVGTLNDNVFIPQTRQTVPMDARGSFSLDFSPFQAREGIFVGDTWEMAVLASDIETSDEKPVRTSSVRVTCERKKEIEYKGETITAFEAKAANGAMAWYSADGTVLKSCFKLMNMLDLVAVRDDNARPPPVPGAKKSQWKRREE